MPIALGKRSGSRQPWWLLSSGHLPRGVWPSDEVGGSLLPAPGLSPTLGSPPQTSLISDLLICMMSFWVLEIEPSCSALPCPALSCRVPVLGSSRGSYF